MRNHTQAFRIVQGVGDVVMVPTGWTHGTQNLHERTVSVSTEFQDGSLPSFQEARRAWSCLA